MEQDSEEDSKYETNRSQKNCGRDGFIRYKWSRRRRSQSNIILVLRRMYKPFMAK